MSDKSFPVATDEVAKMMGLSAAEAHGLPVPDHAEVHVHVEHADHVDHAEQTPSMTAKVVKTAAPYVLVFAVGIFVYFFFFTKIDLGKLFPAKNAAPQNVQNVALMNLEKQNMASYQTWIKSFYYDVSDPAVLDPNGDNSGNGLTNFQKYLLNLNPKSYDTLGLGRADSEDLAMGINPLSGLALNDNQKQIVAQYFDTETISNKLALNKMNGIAGTGKVAGAQTFGNQNTVVTSTPTNSNPVNNPNVVNANDLGVNADIPGELGIPSLKISTPLIFSKSTQDFDKDLLNGVIHYPGTAMPGQIGTAYISGHSSNYPWVKSKYNQIFTHLGDLAVNQSFTITVHLNNGLNNGKTATLHYVVTGSQQYSATDQAQFQNGGKSVVALSTCWPVGSTAKRLVVTGELTQVEQ